MEACWANKRTFAENQAMHRYFTFMRTGVREPSLEPQDMVALQASGVGVKCWRGSAIATGYSGGGGGTSRVW